MRILLIEDDAASAQSIELMLKSEGHFVRTTDLGEEGFELAKLGDYDLILLDLNLPDMNGFDVLRDLRTAGIKTPVIVETGSSAEKARVQALNDGADDFMTKPFSKDELLARCYAVVRRSLGSASSTITVANVCLCINGRTVHVDGARVHLTGREYQVLEILLLRKGSVVTKEMMLSHLYGGADEPELKIIDVFVCHLRKKLTGAGAPQHLIETAWGRGYAVREPERSPVQDPVSDSPAPELRRTG